MRTLVSLLLIGLLATAAAAGGNPNVKCYVSFDQTGAGDPIHQYTMTQYVGFNAYFCFTDLDLGLTTVSFRINNPQAECPGLFASQSFTNLLDIIVGDPYTGMSLASSTCRDEEVVVVGYLNLFPIAVGDCCVNILDDPSFPRWVVDCTTPNGLVDYYCVLENGTIGAADCPEGDCVEALPNPDVGLALHVDYEGHDCSYNLADCAFINTRTPWVPGELLDFMVMTCYYPNGFMGAEYSLVWPEGWQFVNWQSCADYDEDPFDGTNGDGTIQWWDTCQPAPGPAGGPTTIGILTLMVGDTRGPVFIREHPDSGLAGVYNCIPTLDVVLPDTIGNGRAGYVYVGAQDGCNPCFCVGPPCWPFPAPVEDKSWGQIKALFK